MRFIEKIVFEEDGDYNGLYLFGRILPISKKVLGVNIGGIGDEFKFYALPEQLYNELKNKDTEYVSRYIDRGSCRIIGGEYFSTYFIDNPRALYYLQRFYREPLHFYWDEIKETLLLALYSNEKIYAIPPVERREEYQTKEVNVVFENSSFTIHAVVIF